MLERFYRLTVHAMALLRWELIRVFTNRAPWLFCAVFLALAQALVFYFSAWLDRDRADMSALYGYVPWLLVVLVPALAMNSWAEERRLGTLALRIAKPVWSFLHVTQMFRAAWLMVILAVLGLASLWLTATWLGAPDHMLALSAWLGMVLLGGCYLAVSQFASSLTSHPLFAFVLGLGFCVAISLAGSPVITDLLGSSGSGSTLGLVLDFLKRALHVFAPLSHFQEFTRGFVSLGSVLYFALFIYGFLVFSWAGLFAYNKPRAWGLGVVCLVLAIVLGKQFALLGLDLTQDKRNSLPASARALLTSLDDKATVTLYSSEDFGDYSVVFQQVRDRIDHRLRRFSQLSAGSVSYSRLDVELFSEAEDKALSYGLLGIPTDASGSEAYLGVVIESDGGEFGVIPVITSATESEFDKDFLREVFKVGRTSRPVLAVVTSLPILGVGFGGRQIPRPQLIEELARVFDLVPVYSGARLAEIKPDLVLMAQPDGLPSDLAFEFEQYLLRGGASIIMRDPFIELEDSRQSSEAIYGEGEYKIDDLLANIGISVSDMVVSDASLGEVVSVPVGSGFRSLPFPAWLNLDLSLQPVFTSGAYGLPQGHLLIPSSGSLQVAEKDGIKIEPLLRSSPDAGYLSVDDLRPPYDVTRLLEAPSGDIGSKLMALRARGVIKRAMVTPPNLGAVKDSDSAGIKLLKQHIGARLVSSVSDFDLVVFADSDFITDRFWLATRESFSGSVYEAFRSNGYLFMSLVESFQDDFSALSDLSSSDNFVLSFTRLAEIRADAERDYRTEESRLLDRVKQLSQSLRDKAGVADDDDLEAFRTELVDTRSRLREIRYQLNGDINRSKGFLRFLNVFLLPALFLLLGWLVCWLWARGAIRRSGAVFGVKFKKGS